MAVRTCERRLPPWRNKTKIFESNKMRPIKAETKNSKTLVIVQEIKLARLLANNDKRVRDKVLKRLKKWLTVRSQSLFTFTKTDFMSLWKGLFYCMWMSDKMLIQEELAESISKLVHCFDSKDTFVLYTNCALKTLGTEWFGIDQYRLDKFSMLVRRILRQIFTVCKNQSWNIEWVTEISQVFSQLFLDKKISVGFNLHITDIYLEELAKVSDRNLPEDAVYEFIKPFAIYLIKTDDERQMKNIMHHVFRYLIFQSDIGLDYMEKFEAWKRAGFPCAHVDDMEKIEIEENSDSENTQLFETENEIEKPLDPRAGRVDVKLPQIPFNATKIVDLLLLHQFSPSSTAKSRRQLLRLVKEFRELSKGRMPLGIKKIRKPRIQKEDMDSKKAALRLLQFERNLFSGKVHKKRKRKRNAEVVCDTLSFDIPRNGDISNLDADAINSESEPINATMTTKTNLQDTDANIVPSKKQKKNNLTSDKFDNKHEITKNKEKLGTKKKSNKAKQIKSNQASDIYSADTNVKYNKKDEQQMSNNTKKFTFALPIFENEIAAKDTNNKSIIKTMSKNNITHNKQAKSLKNELPSQIKQPNSNNSLLEKKEIVSESFQNTIHDTSENFQKTHKIPTILFNENKKPLDKILKINPTSDPFKSKKIKLKRIHDVRLKHKNGECKKKNAAFRTSPIVENKNLPKKIYNKSITKKTISKSSISQNDQMTLLKDKLSNQIQKQTDSRNLSIEKKKVMFGLSRNTAQHTSEYLQQVRKSPSIPYDANKKPLASVLKTNPIPSPFNPFYKKKV